MNDITRPVSTRISQQQIADIGATGETLADFIRNAIEEKLQNDNPAFLKRRKKELQEELNKIEELEKTNKKKKEEVKNLTGKEIQFLIESKRLIEENPNFLDGRINLFLNNFGKPYKLSRKDFYKLMDEVETQSQEKEIFQEVEN